MTHPSCPPWWSFCVLAALIALVAPLGAQPDPRQMAGIPRPVDDLPNGSVSVRVIRGGFTNNIPNQTVELHVGSDVLKTKTDAEGRAQFDKLTPGAAGEGRRRRRWRAPRVAAVSRAGAGRHSAPARCGRRDGRRGCAPGPPAVTGQVVIGGQSRIIMQPGEETVALYYLLEILNNATVPVNPTTPFAFDMPPGATGTGILQGSSPLATVDGPRVIVSGPFPPGSTLVQVGASITETSGSFDLVQRFPAALTDYAVIVKKLGDTKMSSSQLAGQQVIPAQGETFIGAEGTPVAEGQPLTVSLTDMPHHSATPRRTALALALGIVLVGVWTATPEQRRSRHARQRAQTPPGAPREAARRSRAARTRPAR